MSRFVLLAILCLGLSSPTVLGQDDPASDREQAKQQKLEEQWRKREERIARRDLEGQDRKQRAGKRETKLPRNLARVQETVRRSAVGQDPTVQIYLDRIDREEATPHELAAFGNFLSDSGLTREALEYYRAALSTERKDPLLWLNLGTLHRKLGEASPALAAYSRTLSLDSNNALAHYNVGVILDSQGKYEDAIEAYTVALTLDPSLGDPTVNPKAANNERLLAVKLRLYQQQAGTLGTPLVNIPVDTPERQEQPPEQDEP